MKNQIKTVVLLASLTGLLLFVGGLFAGRQGLFIALVFSLGFNFVSYWFSDKIVLAMYRAKEADKNSKLVAIVKRVSQKANLPMPRVYQINNANPNAFATGRNPKNASVAFTTGILDLLDDKELEGVIAHELSHVKNRDILVATIAAAIAGVISYLAMMARWAAIFGGMGGNRDDGTNIGELLVLAILTPLIATIIQLAISRSREYLADESAVKILHSTHGLASALKKLEHGTKLHPMASGNKATASLFIINPFKGKSIIQLFSTHPPISKRIEKLNALRL